MSVLFLMICKSAFLIRTSVLDLIRAFQYPLHVPCENTKEHLFVLVNRDKMEKQGAGSTNSDIVKEKKQ